MVIGKLPAKLLRPAGEVMSGVVKTRVLAVIALLFAGRPASAT
jgi:hypothetical protein